MSDIKSVFCFVSNAELALSFNPEEGLMSFKKKDTIASFHTIHELELLLLYSIINIDIKR
jgi:hypothetical protein